MRRLPEITEETMTKRQTELARAFKSGARWMHLKMCGTRNPTRSTVEWLDQETCRRYRTKTRKKP